MKDVVYRARALRDLDEIMRFIAYRSGSVAVAERYQAEMEARIVAIARHGRLTGHNRPDLAEGLRSYPMGDYIVFARHFPSFVQVVRILRAARDYRRFRFDEDGVPYRAEVA